MSEKIKGGYFNMPYFIKNLDMFGKKVPQINIRGQTVIKSSIGACLSIITVALTFSFGLLKLEHLVLSKNPLINTYKEPVEEDEHYQLPNKNFMVAFGAEKLDGTPLNDPRYIKWVARFMIDDKILSS